MTPSRRADLTVAIAETMATSATQPTPAPTTGIPACALPKMAQIHLRRRRRSLPPLLETCLVDAPTTTQHRCPTAAQNPPVRPASTENSPAAVFLAVPRTSGGRLERQRGRRGVGRWRRRLGFVLPRPPLGAT
uniref:Uncharacterized protein n=1 Tax=Arundo donax TaxID=35708 RepID=A0A0A9F5E1_ARUDO